MNSQRLTNLLLLLVVFYLFVLQLCAIWPFTIDDMYIPLRYAKHWAEGSGLVWNVKEAPVEGYSNFSFVVIARIALALGFDPVVVLKGAGVIGLLCTCIAVYAITRMWFLTRLAFIPCIWLLAYKGQIIWSVSGLETTVYEALIGFSIFFIFRGLGYSKRCAVDSPLQGKKSNLRLIFFIVAGVLMALAGMTRPEAPALTILFVLLLLFNQSDVSPKVPNELYWWSVLVFCGTFFVCFAPYFFWRWHYYGRFLPNPVYCKGLTNGLTLHLDKRYLQLIWPFVILALPVFWQEKDKRYYFLFLPSIVYLLLLIGSDPIVAFDNRLFLPAFVLFTPLTLKGMSILLNQYMQKSGGRDGIFDTVIYLGAFLFAFFFIPMMSLEGYRHFTENPLAGEQLRKTVVAWLTRHTGPVDRVVLADSGLIPYQSQHRFIDSYCLNNIEMAQTPRANMYQLLCDGVLKARPEVVILTSVIEDGRTNYTPADSCLVLKLAHNKEYSKMISLGTGNERSFYRYEIYQSTQKM